jgi:hypothetical protein
MPWVLDSEASSPIQTAFAATSVGGRWVFRGQPAVFAWNPGEAEPRWVRRLANDILFPHTEIVGAAGLAITFEDQGAKKPSRLCAFDPETGRERWSALVGLRGMPQGLVRRGDQVALQGTMRKVGSFVVTFDAATGEELAREAVAGSGGLIEGGSRIFCYGQRGLQRTVEDGFAFEPPRWVNCFGAAEVAGGLVFSREEEAEGWAGKLVELRSDAPDEPLEHDAAFLTHRAALVGARDERAVLARLAPGGGFALFDLDRGALRWQAEAHEGVEPAQPIWTPHGWVVKLAQSGQPATWLMLDAETGQRRHEFERPLASLDRGYWLDDRLFFSSPTRLVAYRWAP